MPFYMKLFYIQSDTILFQYKFIVTSVYTDVHCLIQKRISVSPDFKRFLSDFIKQYSIYANMIAIIKK